LRYTRYPVRAFSRDRADQVEFVMGFSPKGGENQLPALTQRPRIGIIGGWGLTHDFPDSPGYIARHSQAAGVVLELPLARQFSFELDGIYRPLLLKERESDRQALTVVTFEFPLLAKYRFQGTTYRPFVGVGPSLRSAGNKNNTEPSKIGITAETGIDIPLWKLKISPTLRFTHWKFDPPPLPSPPGPASNQDQLEALIGFTF
jgi:hypothetical protein